MTLALWDPPKSMMMNAPRFRVHALDEALSEVFEDVRHLGRPVAQFQSVRCPLPPLWLDVVAHIALFG